MANLRMSQRDYDELNQSRRRIPTKAERRAIWDRMAKRYLKAQGYIDSKIPSTWTWTDGEQSGLVIAFTVSQVRAEIKKTLGKKLPANLIIEKVQNVE